MHKIVKTQPFADQNPGTSGLRKKTDIFLQPHYTENFFQAIFNATNFAGKILVVGGDGRFAMPSILQILCKMAAANGVARIVTGLHGLMATPDISRLIREKRAAGGIILSASHNPGGKNGDFGIKLNIASGGPAPLELTDRIYNHSQRLQNYKIVDLPDFPLDRRGIFSFGGMRLEIMDSVSAYGDMMEKIFDFSAIRQWFADGFSMRFDAMHAVSGIYAREIFQNRLGVTSQFLQNCKSLPDFGGKTPDPNPANAAHLHALMQKPTAPDIGAACDGDGDRNLVWGKGFVISPCDALAVFCAQAHLVPGLQNGLCGIARSMPTSTACDHVAAKLQIPCYETPTGWKFFVNLLDHGKISICGEESAGAGGAHIREKDGLWAILFWLNILARKRLSLRQILVAHWQEYGRNYYQRHDYENLDPQAAHRLIAALEERIPKLPKTICQGEKIISAENFCYHDPVDGGKIPDQGIRICFLDESRIIFRLSGTGTQNATLRIYLDRPVSAQANHSLNPAQILARLSAASRDLGMIEHHCGHKTPDRIN